MNTSMWLSGFCVGGVIFFVVGFVAAIAAEAKSKGNAARIAAGERAQNAARRIF